MALTLGHGVGQGAGVVSLTAPGAVTETLSRSPMGVPDKGCSRIENGPC